MPENDRLSETDTPRHTLTFLMTDVVGSTRLWEANPALMKTMTALDRIVQDLVTGSKGRVIKSRGEGDSHFSVFESAQDALSAASQVAMALKSEPELASIQLHTGVHAGSPDEWDGDFYGPVINRCARIREAAQPGQVLVSEVVHLLARGSSKFKSLGLHRLRDLMEPERLFQLDVPGLDQDFPVPRTLSAHPNNLPMQVTPFIGRSQDLEDLTDLARKERLVTCTGPGGVGKTRLALQAAAGLLEENPDGIWFVDLAQTERPEGVLQILASVVAPSCEPADATIAGALAGQRALLILDNCEHLFDECRRICHALVSACPGLRMLATSRRLLDVRSERVFRLEGMRLPGPGQMADALQFDSVRLFVEQSARRGSRLELNQAAFEGIASICKQLDGLPLAIEIAASLTDVFSITEILTSIAECLDTVRSDVPDDARQQTVRATIEWSRRLLTPEARVLLERVAYFPGSWTLDAACALCGFQANDRRRATALIRELIGHSLVVVSRDRMDVSRFRLLQTTREVLAPGPLDPESAERLVEFVQTLLEQAQERLQAGEEAQAQALVESDWETILRALDAALGTSPAACAAMAANLRHFWASGTRIREGKTWFDRLSRCSSLSPEARTTALFSLASLCIWLGELDRAEEALHDVETALGSSGGYQLARVYGNLAVIRERLGRPMEAKEYLLRCGALLSDHGTAFDQSRLFLNLAAVKLQLEEPLEECSQLMRQALDKAVEANLPSQQANAHSSLGHVRMLEGRYKDALQHCETALALWQNGPFLADCAVAMIDVADILLRMKLCPEASRAFHVAEHLQELSESPFTPPQADRLAACGGDLKKRLAETEWRAARRLTRSKGADEQVGIALQIIKDALALDDQPIPETT